MYEIREAREEDRDSVVQVLTQALGSLETFREEWIESWKKYWFKPEYGDWAYVATYNGRVVANLSFFLNDGLNTIRGTPLRVGGVWAVGTEGEHRRKGLLKGLFNSAFASMNEKGIVLSILDPSPYYGAQIAYETCGFALAESRVNHVFPPRALRPVEGNQDITARVFDDPDEYEKILKIERAMCRYGSRVFTWPAIFMEEIRSGHFYILERCAEPVGCAKFSFTTSDDDAILSVSKTYFTSLDVLPSIIELIAQHSEKVTRVEWNCDAHIPVRYYVDNICKLRTQATGTMMMRVVNVEGYCKSIQVPENVTKELVMNLYDTQCPWNQGVYRLNCLGGVLHTERIDETTSTEITLDPFQLSQVTCGIVSPLVLQELGVISCPPETAQKLDAIFPVDSFTSYFRF
jgi:predicted acetyltransferase